MLTTSCCLQLYGDFIKEDEVG